MKPLLFMLMPFLIYSPVKAQEVQHRKTRFPVGLYTTGESDIYGISFGVGSDTYMDSDRVSVRSNGIRIEPVSQALLFFTLIFPIDRVRYPDTPKEIKEFEKKVPNEVINGLNLSCGTNAFADVNGITVSALVQSLRQTNGLSVAGFSSQSYGNNGLQVAAGFTGTVYSNGLLAAMFSTTTHEGKGLQVAGIHNDYDTFSGVQIGMLNGAYGKAEKFSGVQIGLFNNAKKLKGIQIGLINRNEKRILPFFNWNFKD
ncbi:LA_2272 family surface repeat-containing protein [Flavobacterium sp.]|uniref:LA_2272 family surface repeat-containing protein n=1 Tax=Flavobacterium sp. TaxID=239 RepID=UPI0040340F9C